MGTLWLRRRTSGVAPDGRVWLLLAASAALLLSTLPRWSADQVLFVTPVFWALAAWLVGQLPAGAARRTALAAGALLALGALLLPGVNRPRRIPTAFGTVRGQPWDEALLLTLQRPVRPGDRLLVYPYLPLLSVLLGAENPTRYAFLQPGMMGAADEANALADLRARPPRWVLCQNATPERILEVWPNSDRSRLRLEGIEAWVRAHHRSVARMEHPAGPFLLPRRVAE